MFYSYNTALWYGNKENTEVNLLMTLDHVLLETDKILPLYDVEVVSGFLV